MFRKLGLVIAVAGLMSCTHETMNTADNGGYSRAPAESHGHSTSTGPRNHGSKYAETVENATNGGPSLLAPPNSKEAGRDFLNFMTFKPNEYDASFFNRYYEFQTIAESQPLAHCSATVTLGRQYGNLILKISDPSRCSLLVYYPNNRVNGLVDFEPEVIKFPDGKGEQSLNIPETNVGAWNTSQVFLTSISGKNTAKIVVQSWVPFPPRPMATAFTIPEFSLSSYLFGRRWAPLADCGGSVYLNIESGIASLFFNNMRSDCNAVKVLTDDGTILGQNDTPIYRNGQIILNPDLFTKYDNTIKLVITTPDFRTHYDVIRLYIPAFFWPTVSLDYN